MTEDINSPRVRQVLAIHAEQAADAKAKLNAAEARIIYLEAQLGQMFDVAKHAAEWIRSNRNMGAMTQTFEDKGNTVERLAREHIDEPGPCSCQAKDFSGTCPICGQDNHLPF